MDPFPSNQRQQQISPFEFQPSAARKPRHGSQKPKKQISNFGFCLLLLAGASTSFAQVPDSAPAGGQPAPAPAQQAPAPSSSASGGGGDSGDSSGGSKQQGSILGGDVPIFDPGTEIFTWDGKSWHATDNRLFQARFEKYLNAPEETGPQALGYQQVINTILDDLAPGNADTQHIDNAFRLLARASSTISTPGFAIPSPTPSIAPGARRITPSAWPTPMMLSRLSARRPSGMPRSRPRASSSTKRPAGTGRTRPPRRPGPPMRTPSGTWRWRSTPSARRRSRPP